MTRWDLSSVSGSWWAEMFRSSSWHIKERFQNHSRIRALEDAWRFWLIIGIFFIDKGYNSLHVWKKTLNFQVSYWAIHIKLIFKRNYIYNHLPSLWICHDVAMLVGEDLTPVMPIAPFKRSIFSQSTTLNEYILELETCFGSFKQLGMF